MLNCFEIIVIQCCSIKMRLASIACKLSTTPKEGGEPFTNYHNYNTIWLTLFPIHPLLFQNFHFPVQPGHQMTTKIPYYIYRVNFIIIIYKQIYSGCINKTNCCPWLPPPARAPNDAKVSLFKEEYTLKAYRSNKGALEQ